jgi:hypothetical protein
MKEAHIGGNFPFMEFHYFVGVRTLETSTDAV